MQNDDIKQQFEIKWMLLIEAAVFYAREAWGLSQRKFILQQRALYYRAAL